MLLKDFEYAGHRLSEFGCIVCYLTSNSSISEIAIGCDVTFNTVKNNHSSISQIVSTQYDTVYTTPFQIMKYKCNDKKESGDLNSCALTDIEVRRLIKWLNRRSYEKFMAVYEDGSYSDVRYYGSFNVKEIRLGNQVIGLSLVFTANAPYGFGEEIEFDYELSGVDDEIYIESDSDEIGYIYPKVLIEVKESGDLRLHNQLDNRTTVIKNCVVGEIITLDGELKLIESSMDHQGLFNDFNYEYPRISNECNDEYEDENVVNIYTVSLPCNINIKYSPIRKTGVV